MLDSVCKLDKDMHKGVSKTLMRRLAANTLLRRNELIIEDGTLYNLVFEDNVCIIPDGIKTLNLATPVENIESGSTLVIPSSLTSIVNNKYYNDFYEMIQAQHSDEFCIKLNSSKVEIFLAACCLCNSVDFLSVDVEKLFTDLANYIFDNDWVELNVICELVCYTMQNSISPALVVGNSRVLEKAWDAYVPTFFKRAFLEAGMNEEGTGITFNISDSVLESVEKKVLSDLVRLKTIGISHEDTRLSAQHDIRSAAYGKFIRKTLVESIHFTLSILGGTRATNSLRFSKRCDTACKAAAYFMQELAVPMSEAAIRYVMMNSSNIKAKEALRKIFPEIDNFSSSAALDSKLFNF